MTGRFRDDGSRPTPVRQPPLALVMPDGRVYLVDTDRVRWRVHDVVYGSAAGGPHRRRAHPPPYGPAPYRFFVRRDGLTRCHTFEPGEPREVEATLLARQLEGAAYVMPLEPNGRRRR